MQKIEMLELVRARYTCKSFDKNKKLSKEELVTIMEILQKAPSALNVQSTAIFL